MEDLISRQAVLDAFWKLNIELRPNAIDAILNMVNDMPSVNPQPKVGHWIEDRCDMYICSECDHVYTDLSGERYEMYYCPACGAKMVETQERSGEG